MSDRPMTPEDTPRMAERTDRQAQIDPWAKVEYERGLMGDTPSVQYDRRDLVDAARAADALRHQQETADLTRAVQGNALAVVKASAEGGSQIADLRAALSTAEATIASLTAQVEQQKQEIASWRQVLTMEAVEEIKSLRAERDALAAQVTALETELDETSAFIARATTGPDSPLNLAVDVEARAIRAEAERDAAQQKLADLAAGGNTAAKCVIAVAEDLIAACEARNAAQQQAGDMQLIANEQEQRAIKAEQERDAAQQEIDRLKASVASLWASSPCECWPGHTCNACTIYNAALTPRPQEPRP